MDGGSLDLCISCGAYAADGTYCSQRCRSVDTSSPTPSSSYSIAYPASSSSHHHSSSYGFQQARRRPLLDLQEQSCSQHYTLASEEPQINARKLASIAEWAKGVWGDAGDEDVPRSHKATTLPKSSPVRAKHTTRPATRSYTPPRFQLTAANLAPPTITHSHTSSDASSSVHTPSSSPSVTPAPVPRKSRKADVVDPWISSPPYEFAYAHQQQQRGRTLVRV